MAYDDDEYEWMEDPEQLGLPFDDDVPNSQLSFEDADQEIEQTTSVDRYQIPTATSNPQRPRTVAAKYIPEERAIYVVMRPYKSHGNWKTPIVKYFPCNDLDWKNFKGAYSKGRFIARNWDGTAGQQTKDWIETGTLGADNFLLSAAAYARAQQIRQQGIQEGQSTQSDIYKKLQKAVKRGDKVTRITLRTSGGVADKLGGTGRKRQQNAMLNDAVQSFYRNKGRLNP